MNFTVLKNNIGVRVGRIDTPEIARVKKYNSISEFKLLNVTDDVNKMNILESEAN